MAKSIDVSATFKDENLTRYFTDLVRRAAQIEQRDKIVAGIMGTIVYRDVIRHFERQEGPDGPWQQWSNSYRRQMWRDGKLGNKILQNTGRLRMSFSPVNYRTSKDGLTWYNNAQTRQGFPYAFAHDNDTEPRFQLPRRSFMWLSDDALGEIESAIVRFLRDG